MIMPRAVIVLMFMLPALGAIVAGHAAEPAKSVTKTESFDRDPGWDSYNNRIVPRKFRMISQDFGFSSTNIAGTATGEMGGWVWRASQPAFYGDKIEPRTLNDRLTASG